MKHFIKIILFIFIVSNNLYANAEANNNISLMRNLIKGGYIKTAIEYLKENNNNKELKNILIKALYEKGYYKNIVKLLKNASNINELPYLIKSYIFLLKFKKAINLMENNIKILNEEYNDLEKLYNGMIYYSKYDYKNAIKNIQGIYKKDIQVFKFLIKIFCLMNNFNKARIYLKFVPEEKAPYLYGYVYYGLKDYLKALQYLKKVSTNDSLILQYNCYIMLKDYNNAIKVLEKIDQDTSYDLFYKKINLLFSYKKYDEIIYRLKDLKDSYLKFYFLGKSYLMMRNYHKAIYFLEKGLKLKKESDGIFSIGLAYFKIGYLERAIQYFKDVIDYQDSKVLIERSYFYSGMANYQLGKFKQAISYFNGLILFEDVEPELIKKSYKYLALCYEKEGDFIKAIDNYEKLKEISENEDIDLKIAELWEKYGKLDYAYAIYKRFLPIKGKNKYYILKKLGFIAQKLGELKASNIYLEQFLKKTGSKNEQILFVIALNYLNLERLSKAKKILMKFVELGKNSKIREEALFWIGMIYFKTLEYNKALLYFERLYISNPHSLLSQKALKYICISAVILKDKNTLKKYMALYSNPHSIFLYLIKNKKIDLDYLQYFIDKTSDEKKYQIFHNLLVLIEKNDIQSLKKIIYNYELSVDNKLFYFMAGKRLTEKGLDNLAIYSMNKFLNYPFDERYVEEYIFCLQYVIKYYFAEKNYGKIIELQKIYNNIKIIPLDLRYLIGYSFYKYNLKRNAVKYLFNFILDAKNDKKVFKASFYLDKLNELDKAEIGYKKVLSDINDKSLKKEALFWLGEIYLKKGQYYDALSCFFRIKNNFKYDDKWTPTALFKIAKIYELLGEKSKALEEYKSLMKKLPANDPRKNFIKNKLKVLERNGN